MAKSVNNDVLDAALDTIALANRIDVCSQEPLTRTEAITTYTLGNYTMTPGDGNGDYTVGEGDTNGRKVAILAQTGNNASGSGTGNHVALTDGTRLLYVTTCPNVSTNAGQPLDIATWDVEIADPT